MDVCVSFGNVNQVWNAPLTSEESHTGRSHSSEQVQCFYKWHVLTEGSRSDWIARIYYIHTKALSQMVHLIGLTDLRFLECLWSPQGLRVSHFFLCASMLTFASIESDEHRNVLECHLRQGVTQNSKGFGPVHVLVVTSANQDCHDIISRLYKVISLTAFCVTGDWVIKLHPECPWANFKSRTFWESCASWALPLRWMGMLGWLSPGIIDLGPHTRCSKYTVFFLLWHCIGFQWPPSLPLVPSPSLHLPFSQ